MGRIRTIKPEFPQSQSMGRVSRDARLCFIQLWTLVDDAGRTRAPSRMLASLLYPYDDDAGTLIEGWLAELEREGCIVRYDSNGNNYLEICKWSTHQKIDHPSSPKHPAPKEHSRKRAESSRALAVGSRTKEGNGSRKGLKTLAEPEEGIFSFPVIGDSTYSLPQALYDAYVRTYTGVTVMRELETARTWLLNNHLKTPKGMPRFLNSWMSRAQDQGGRNGNRVDAHAGRGAGPDKALQNAENLRAARAGLRRDYDGADGDGLFAGHSSTARVLEGDRGKVVGGGPERGS